MATKQNLMLESIRMEYHSFRKDQVLTHKQLNDLIEYFEDQDRLTRTCLTGVGVVCGLKIKNVAGTDPFVELSKGVAVTTDGDLLKSDTLQYRHFRSYVNTKKGTDIGIYDPFYFQNNGTDQQMELWELTRPNNSGVLPERSKELKSFKAESGKNIEELAALLYIEYYLQEPDKCTAIDCDNQGPHQVATPRLLLISQADLERVINRDPVNEEIHDSIYTKWNNAATQHRILPVLKAKRVTLNNFNTANPSALKSSYTSILNSESGKLLDAIEKLFNAYGFLLNENDETGFSIVAFKQELQSAITTNVKVQQAQYLYDFYKDVLEGYNELRDSIFGLIYECCPDIKSFPKHIMLGLVKNPAADQYRHKFYPSPAVTANKKKLDRCKLLWQRIVKMVETINIPDQFANVKITPSTDYDQLIEKRAIPFYYNPTTKIVGKWNHSISSQKQENHILSYHAPGYADGTDSTINPLDYNIDANNFFRIEGHIGKTLSLAISEIDKIKNNKSLPFDVIALRLEKNGNTTDIDPDDYDSQFEDLNTMLQAWLTEQQCLYASVASFFSGFNNRRESGFHSNIAKYNATQKPQAATEAQLMLSLLPQNMEGKLLLSQFPQGKEIPSSGAATRKKTTSGITETFLMKGLFKQDKTVSNNLETNSDALGRNMKFLVSNPALTKDAIVAQLERDRAGDLNPAVITAEEKEVVFSTPVQMVAEVNELARFNPQRLADINTNSIEAYKKRSDAFCKYVRLLHDRMSQIFKQPTYKQNGFESYYLFILQEVIGHCCAGKQLEIILSEIEKRKQKILESLIFANYALQHPGMEHKAGVHRGGTFILVYTTEAKTTKNIKEVANRIFERTEEEKSFIEKILKKEDLKSRITAYDDIESLALYIFENQDEVDISDEFEKYKEINGIKDGSPREIKDMTLLKKYLQRLAVEFKEEENKQISNNMVIADFCLPYLCCSDCPPVAFIVPKQQYNLSLLKSSICSDETDLLEFRREPFDGKVTAEGFDNAIIENAGKVFFDVSKVKEADFGKEIQFKIEGQVTECRLTVFKHPVAKFEAKVKEDTDAILVVEFTNSSDDNTGKQYIYDWNFGDNSPVSRVSNKDIFTRTYKKQLLESLGLIGVIPVKLTAINGPCSSFVEVPVKYKREEPVSLTLPATAICNDKDRLAFNVTPADGKVACVNNPATVVKDGSGSFLFDPKLATTFSTPLTFTVNDKPTDCTIIVFKHPVPKFTIETAQLPSAPHLLAVTLKNESEVDPTAGNKFIWTLSNGQSHATLDKNPFTMNVDLNAIRSAGNKLNVELQITNIVCTAKSESKPVQLPALPQVSCIDITRESLRAEINFFNSAEFTNALSAATASTVIRNRRELITNIGLLGATNLSKAIKTLASNYIDLLARINESADKFGNETVRGNLLKELTMIYNRAINNDFDAKVKNSVMMFITRSVFKASLNIIRCQGLLDGVTKEVMISLLGINDTELAMLKRDMPSLNSGGDIIKFTRAYERQAEVLAANGDTQIRQVFKDFTTKINQHFAV
jgi:hypothetical protein